MRVNVRQTVGGENSEVTRFYVIASGERPLARILNRTRMTLVEYYALV